MKKNHRSIYITVLLLMSFLFTGALFAGDEVKFLAKVDVEGKMIHQLGLPVYAHPGGETEEDYILTITTGEKLENSGFVYTILDTINIGNTNNAAEYALLSRWEEGGEIILDDYSNVLLDDGANLLLKVQEEEKRALTEKGYNITWIGDEPMVFPESMVTFSAETAPGYDVTYNKKVDRLIKSITEDRTRYMLSGLTGETPIFVGGQQYTITTRNTNSGTPIARATQYVYEFMQGKGYTVSYHNWNGTNKNVIAEKEGTTRKNEIIIVIGHLDNMPSRGRAPGADDNASGTIGVMLAAETLSTITLERTVRFVLVTGEEQGLLGSKEYARKIQSAGDNVVGVFNMDMIAWDGKGGPYADLTIRKSSSPGYGADYNLASTVVKVDSAYSIGNFEPQISASGMTASDHSSFWSRGYPAFCLIEDRSDFNPYYHTANDNLSTVNIPYFTGNVQAIIGTVCHLAGLEGDTPEPGVLKDGESASSSLSGQGQTEMWTIDIPEGTTSMKTVLESASGNDYDVYGKQGEQPDTTVYDWRGYETGNEEVDFANPVSGKWFIMVRSYSGSGPYTIKCTLTGGTNPQKPQISSFTLSPASIVEGESATISWTISNAHTITASDSWTGEKTASGSETIGTSLQPGTYTYTLTATNSAGSVEKSVILKVTQKGNGCPAWEENKSYTSGDCVSYGGTEYICLQPHTSLAGWTPAAVPALWRLK